jgi:hypothetical protein
VTGDLASRGSRLGLFGLGAVLVAALAGLVAFDLGPPLPFNDDWAFAWTARELVAGHGLRIVPDQSALALVQAVWGAMLSFGHPDQRVLRLTLVPFAFITAWCAYALGRRLNANRFWSLAAAVAVFTNPLFLTVATSYMTDIPYVALLMLGLVAAARWLEDDGPLWPVVVFWALATLQRQQGALLPAGATIALLVVRRARLSRRDAWSLALLWMAVVAPLAGAALTAVVPPTQARRLATLTHPTADQFARPVVKLMAMAGFFAIPFLVGLITRLQFPRARRATAYTIVVLGVGLTAAAAILGLLFSGDYLNAQGLNPLHLEGTKPSVFPPATVLAVIVLASVAGVAWLIRALRGVEPGGIGWVPTATVLAGVAAMQLVPLVQTGVLDRYYLPVVVPLVPIAAAMAGRPRFSAAAKLWFIAWCTLSVAAYGVGEYDYQAWSAARDQAAMKAYELFPASQVHAGYEANAVHDLLPQYLATGKFPYPPPTGAESELAVNGPLSPRLVLMFAPPGDMRPGVTYRSLGPGRIILVLR